MDHLSEVRAACKLGTGEFTELSGNATCALYAGETPPDLTALIAWLEKYPEVYVDDLLVPVHTRDVALFGRTLASHLMLLRLDKMYAKKSAA